MVGTSSIFSKAIACLAVSTVLAGASANAQTIRPKPHQPDFADSLSGGPDFWKVANVPPGESLRVHIRPSAKARSVARLRNGSVVQNRGCRLKNQIRWCKIEQREGGASGWVPGRYLIEFVGM